MTTLTFPREWPVGPRLVGGTFALTIPGPVSRTIAGHAAKSESGAGFFSATFTTEQLNDARWNEVDAWLSSLGGAFANRFYLYDPRRTVPLAYRAATEPTTRAAGGAWNGGAVLTTTAAADSRILALESLPAHYVLSPGDHVHTSSSTGVPLFFQVELGGTASSGGVLSIRVAPRLQMPVSAGATVWVRGARCLMVLAEDYTPPDRGFGRTAITFKGRQVFTL